MKCLGACCDLGTGKQVDVFTKVTSYLIGRLHHTCTQASEESYICDKKITVNIIPCTVKDTECHRRERVFLGESLGDI